MPQPDEIRAQLIREIERRQQQLDALRDALRSLDAALEAAAAAHAASLAAVEKSMGSQVAAATRMAKSSTHAIARPVEAGERRREGSSGTPPEGLPERRKRPRGNSGMRAAVAMPAAAVAASAPVAPSVPVAPAAVVPAPVPQIVLEAARPVASAAAPVPPPAPVAPVAPVTASGDRVAAGGPTSGERASGERASGERASGERASGEERPAVPSLRAMNLGRYANMKVWRAVQHVLTEKRRAMTFEEIVHCLQEGGASLGPSPMRTVTTAVGYMNDKIFHVSKHNNVTTVSVLQPFQ